MTITKRLDKGEALTYAEADENFRDLSERMGWSDYNDLTTQAAPIALTIPGTFYGLTNDGAGPFSQNAHKIVTHGEIWDVGTDKFDFSSLAIGDTVDFRVDVEVTTTGPARDIEGRIELAIGSGGDYTLPGIIQSFKNAGVYQIVRWNSIYIGDNNTKDFPARIVISSDEVGTTVKVNGWYVRTQVR